MFEHFKSVEENLQKDESGKPPTHKVPTMKQEVAKLVLVLSMLPQFLYTVVAMVLDIRPVYILVFLILFSCLLYWLIEAKFNLLLTAVDHLRTFFTP